MTMLKVARFNIHRQNPEARAEAAPRPAAQAATPRAAAAAAAAADAMPFDTQDDGFGDQAFPGSAAADRAAAAAATANPATAAAAPAPAPAPAPASPSASPPARPDASVEAILAAIRREGLTGRQLRTARRLAQRHNLQAISDFDAVRLLRDAGVDPFQRGSMLELVSPEAAPDTASDAASSPASAPGSPSGPRPDAALPSPGRALTPLPGDGVRLPETVKPIRVPTPEQRAEVNHAAEILKMQQDIARRRRRKLSLLAARMFIFVLLPTILAGWYFAKIATPLYSTRSEFVIQQADPPQSAGLGGLLSGTGLATSQDSIAVQGYLQSREAMQRLEADHGFRVHFQGSEIDPITRLPADASLEQAYKLYRKYVLISYDPTEGLVKMEVMAADPQLSADWSRQLIAYAEEQVDQLTQRLREDSMKGARESYKEAEAAVIASQEHVVELQEKYKVLSSDVEVGLLTTQISQLETLLTQEKLNLAQMEANESPNVARIEPVRRRISTLEEEIALLRGKLTQGQVGDESLARIQGELLVAQADVETRQMVLAQSLQAMENARIEANRQVRYLSLSVTPVPPDEAAYPRAFENTLVTMLILLGIYLMVSMTAAILREQVSA
ncbi:capsule biosynthesis protein [Rhodobacter sp. Har01]|uniref:capsule biosynthesis protein n=1 Tax=Rhodobacter sp. Har01 TaxID=2883999 RepID=UPI001D095224|nr:capsule biosynthesis protein [Rhodobacter sp. Har01]MCB6177059.1 capsule biosynthesis protein [Rhodobacter sp. Har01]